MSEPHPFSRLPAPFASALQQRGFHALTPVQEAVLAPELQGKDLRISSRTGSGKTVALGLVVGPLLIEEERPAGLSAGDASASAGSSALPSGAQPCGTACARPRVLLVAPTRELAAQIGRELAWLYGELRLGVCVVTGGTSVSSERRLLARNPMVVVGTPGRLCDHLERGALDLRETEAVVLDEADQMLDLGFREALESLLGSVPAGARRHLVSATFPRPVLSLAARYQKSAVMVRGDAPAAGHEDIAQIAYLIDPRERYAALVNVVLLAPEERTLVFVRTRVDAAEVAARLAADGFRAGALSGELAQAERTRTLEAFRGGSLAIMVCTDVASRGLDVPQVARVIHAELPSDPQVLTHRSGRTGRAGHKGTSILLVASHERDYAEQLLMRAGIVAELARVPGPRDVERAAEARLLEQLTRAPEPQASAPSDAPGARGEPRASSLAARLVAELGAERAVERLLAQLSQAQPGAGAARTLTPVPLRAPRAHVRSGHKLRPYARAPRRAGRA